MEQLTALDVIGQAVFLIQAPIGLGFTAGEGSASSLASALADESFSVTSETAIKFQRLRDRWRAERPPHSSSIATIAMCASYQAIIGLGPPAIGLILGELRSQKDPEPWFWALAAISGENPVPVESRGKTREMADAWLAWGIKNGYIA